MNTVNKEDENVQCGSNIPNNVLNRKENNNTDGQTDTQLQSHKETNKNNDKNSHRLQRGNRDTAEKTHHYSVRNPHTDNNSYRQTNKHRSTREKSHRYSEKTSNLVDEKQKTLPKYEYEESCKHTKNNEDPCKTLQDTRSQRGSKGNFQYEHSSRKSRTISTQSKMSVRHSKSKTATSRVSNSSIRIFPRNEEESKTQSTNVRRSKVLIDSEEIKSNYSSKYRASNSIEKSLLLDLDDYEQQVSEHERKVIADQLSDKSLIFKDEQEYWLYKSDKLYDITSNAGLNQTQSRPSTATKKRIFKITNEASTKLPLRVAVITDHKILRVAYQDSPKSKTYINIQKCTEFFKRYKKDTGMLKKDFEKLSLIPNYSKDHGQQEKFLPRNVFPACSPFDYNRVKLCNLLSDEDPEDYFNASYIMDTKGGVFCIASQCPMREEVQKFWSMIYENHCTLILSLIDHDDPDNKACKYWPSKEKSISAQKFTLESVSLQKNSSLTIRDIKINPKMSHSPLVVRHINWVSWRNYTDTPRVGEFVRLRNAIITCLEDPIDALPLIHCKSGSGRTALLIAFCMAYNYLLKMENFDMIELIKYLQKQRPYFFDTEEKYKFFHKLIECTTESLGINKTKKNL